MSFFTKHLKLLAISIILVLYISVHSQDINSSKDIVFTKSTQPFNSENTNSIGLADFNNNGSLDVVFANMGFVNSLIWFNDGDTDIVVTNGYGAIQLPTYIYFNDGTGNFIVSEQELSTTGKGRVAIGDIDTDGLLDIVLTNCQGVNHVWKNDNYGNFILSTILLGNGAMHSPNLSDIDSDGDLDLVIANYFTGQN